TLRWLPLESIRIPSVSGRLVSAVKYLMVCGLPSSLTSKSALVRLGIRVPCLSLTLKNNWTTLTFTFRVSVGCCESSDFCSSGFGLAGCGVCAVDWAEGWGGDCWAMINGTVGNSAAKAVTTSARLWKTEGLGIRDTLALLVKSYSLMIV